MMTLLLLVSRSSSSYQSSEVQLLYGSRKVNTGSRNIKDLSDTVSSMQVASLIIFISFACFDFFTNIKARDETSISVLFGRPVCMPAPFVTEVMLVSCKHPNGFVGEYYLTIGEASFDGSQLTASYGVLNLQVRNAGRIDRILAGFTGSRQTMTSPKQVSCVAYSE